MQRFSSLKLTALRSEYKLSFYLNDISECFIFYNSFIVLLELFLSASQLATV